MTNATIPQLIQFEDGIKYLWESGELPFLLHLAGGNEGQLQDIFRRANTGDWFFCSHRAHYHYLLAGGHPADLEAKIRNGQSMFLFSKEINFLSSSILAGNCCIAAGVAWALKAEGSPSQVWCFLGDGAEDEGHFYEAVNFVQGWDLPCTFVIEDNNRSVETDVEKRRGMADRRDWGKHVIRYHYRATYPHAGSGCAHRISFNEMANPWRQD